MCMYNDEPGLKDLVIMDAIDYLDYSSFDGDKSQWTATTRPDTFCHGCYI